MIYAIDFDGTLAETEYPHIIAPKDDMINFCIRLKNVGHTLILWTCRTGKALDDAIAYCYRRGLIFDYINENTPEVIEQFGGDTRKIFANYYIDDRVVDARILEGAFNGR